MTVSNISNFFFTSGKLAVF